MSLQLPWYSVTTEERLSFTNRWSSLSLQSLPTYSISLPSLKKQLVFYWAEITPVEPWGDGSLGGCFVFVNGIPPGEWTVGNDRKKPAIPARCIRESDEDEEDSFFSLLSLCEVKGRKENLKPVDLKPHFLAVIGSLIVSFTLLISPVLGWHMAWLGVSFILEAFKLCVVKCDLL